MNTDKKWELVLSQNGWKKQGNVFTRPQGDKLFVVGQPDMASGVIPIKIKDFDHDYFAKYSQHIYLGDLKNTWRHPDYKITAIEYQIIKPGLKLEKDTRNQIHQAERKGVIIESLAGNEDAYYDCVLETAGRQNRSGVSRWVYDWMAKIFGGYVAKLNGRVIAGSIVGEEENLIRLLHQASLSEFLSFRPNHLIYNNLLKVAGDREIWLGNIPTGLESLKKFKQTFGAENHIFPLKYYEH